MTNQNSTGIPTNAIVDRLARRIAELEVDKAALEVTVTILQNQIAQDVNSPDATPDVAAG